jgi:hypothetical protein
MDSPEAVQKCCKVSNSVVHSDKSALENNRISSTNIRWTILRILVILIPVKRLLGNIF